jgi:hypothetical protein
MVRNGPDSAPWSFLHLLLSPLRVWRLWAPRIFPRSVHSNAQRQNPCICRTPHITPTNYYHLDKIGFLSQIPAQAALPVHPVSPAQKPNPGKSPNPPQTRASSRPGEFVFSAQPGCLSLRANSVGSPKPTVALSPRTAPQTAESTPPHPREFVLSTHPGSHPMPVPPGLSVCIRVHSWPNVFARTPANSFFPPIPEVTQCPSRPTLFAFIRVHSRPNVFARTPANSFFPPIPEVNQCPSRPTYSCVFAFIRGPMFSPVPRTATSLDAGRQTGLAWTNQVSPRPHVCTPIRGRRLE